MTQDEADLALGRIIREGMVKAMPLGFEKAIKQYINVDLAGLGTVLLSVEIYAEKSSTTH